MLLSLTNSLFRWLLYIVTVFRVGNWMSLFYDDTHKTEKARENCVLMLYPNTGWPLQKLSIQDNVQYIF